jgi:beta-1,4-mannosyltransferase
MTAENLHFVVVVLGDLGRSPRMQYHAMSLLELGENVRVSLVGYTGEELIDGLKGRERLDVIRFHVPTPAALMKIRPLYLIWRIITMALWLLYALLVSVRSNPPVDCILVQNPPALPLLFIALLYTRIKGLVQSKRPRFVIDWHNLGYSMLESSAFRKIAKPYELWLAPMADGHLTVTKAMKTYLLQNTTIRHKPIRVLYDSPPAMFSPLEPADQHKIMSKLHSKLLEAIPRSWNLHSLEQSKETILTTQSNGTFQPRHGRPALVTSSTSWTPDEDFGVLLQALVQLDQTIQKKQSPLKVLVVGPNRVARTR